jgi:hypothetical protein
MPSGHLFPGETMGPQRALWEHSNINSRLLAEPWLPSLVHVWVGVCHNSVQTKKMHCAVNVFPLPQVLCNVDFRSETINATGDGQSVHVPVGPPRNLVVRIISGLVMKVVKCHRRPNGHSPGSRGWIKRSGEQLVRLKPAWARNVKTNSSY